jgi:drug/metabolite transporter (DMT)-like permease
LALTVNWLTVGIASTALFGVIGLMDKIVIERYYRTVWSYPFFTMLFFGLYCSIILVYRMATGLYQSPSFLITLIAIVPGITHFLAAVITTKALMEADASTVFGLSQVNPVFAMLWGFLIFQNIFQWQNYVGIIMIVICALLLGLDNSARRFRVNKVVWWIMGATFARSISDLCLKFALTEMEYWDAFALSRSGLILFAVALLLVPLIRKEIFKPFKQHGIKIVGIAGAIETFAVINLMLVTLAFSLGPLTLVSATQSTAPLFIVIYAFIFNRLKPGFVPLRDNTWGTPVKALLCLGITLGVYLLYAGQPVI